MFQTEERKALYGMAEDLEALRDSLASENSVVQNQIRSLGMHVEQLSGVLVKLMARIETLERRATSHV